MYRWGDLLEFEGCGISVQSHGVSHRRFSELLPEERERELTHSKLVLESGLGQPVELFSFPYGDPGHEQDLASLMRAAGYRAACLYGGGPNKTPISDPFRLTRLAMGPATDLSSELHVSD